MEINFDGLEKRLQMLYHISKEYNGKDFAVLSDVYSLFYILNDKQQLFYKPGFKKDRLKIMEELNIDLQKYNLSKFILKRMGRSNLRPDNDAVLNDCGMFLMVLEESYLTYNDPMYIFAYNLLCWIVTGDMDIFDEAMSAFYAYPDSYSGEKVEEEKPVHDVMFM